MRRSRCGTHDCGDGGQWGLPIQGSAVGWPDDRRRTASITRQDTRGPDQGTWPRSPPYRRLAGRGSSTRGPDVALESALAVSHPYSAPTQATEQHGSPTWGSSRSRSRGQHLAGDAGDLLGLSHLQASLAPTAPAPLVDQRSPRPPISFCFQKVSRNEFAFCVPSNRSNDVVFPWSHWWILGQLCFDSGLRSLIPEGGKRSTFIKALS
jgi:hypothetical protein